MVTLNNEIKLGNEPFDVSEMQRQQRILYFPKKGSIILKCNALAANYDNTTIHNNKAVVLTARLATRKFPQVFSNKNEKKVELDKRTIIVTVSPDLYDYCASYGNISAYIRGLIEQDMVKAKH